MSSATCTFFFNDTATTEIYTLSLHDALPISVVGNFILTALLLVVSEKAGKRFHSEAGEAGYVASQETRSEEHTSELQSRQYLVCRLLLEKKHACTRSTT